MSCADAGGYIYCVGSATSPYNIVYYAPLSITGVGTWSSTAKYPLASPWAAGCSINNGYIYCFGGTSIAPYNQIYYAPISSSGIGTWSSTTPYPISNMYYAWCEIPGYGGGYQSGGGPN